VPLYRTGDLEALREHPGIDWEAVRAVRPGEPSPLRGLARRPVDRAAAIRQWVAEYGNRHGIEVWVWFHPGSGDWELDFERIPGGPAVRDVKAAIAAHWYLRDYPIAVSTEAGAAIRWARAMREPGAAVILDTETTDLDGYAVEIAVVDAATGDTLLDTLVNPGCPIQPGARAVHGISDADVAAAPLLADVLPRLLAVTRGRTVLAYNAAFDNDVIARHTCRDRLDPGHLADARPVGLPHGPPLGLGAALPVAAPRRRAPRPRRLPDRLPVAVRHDRPRPPAQSDGTMVRTARARVASSGAPHEGTPGRAPASVTSQPARWFNSSMRPLPSLQPGPSPAART
jgi:hypothetical protein